MFPTSWELTQVRVLPSITKPTDTTMPSTFYPSEKHFLKLGYINGHFTFIGFFHNVNVESKYSST